MSEAMRDVVRQWFEHVWNRKDLGAIDRLTSADCVIHGLGEGGPNESSLAAFRVFHQVFCAAYPDIQIRIDDMIVEGDKVAWRITFTGTHTGDALGIKATRRPIRVGAIGISRVVNGRIVEGWNEFDRYGMFQQIGAT